MEVSSQLSDCVGDGVCPEPDIVLSLAGHRLRLTGSPVPVVQGARAWMCPPAHLLPVGETASWTVCVEPMVSKGAPAAAAAWTCLLGDYGWPRLATTVSTARSAGAVGQYRPEDALVQIAVDRVERLTHVCVPVDGVHPARWVDWLARAYFGGRLLEEGWLLLHAAAVSFEGRVVLLGGVPGAGKSSLAHVLCRELGAAFLGDDLVFVTASVDRGVQAIGWPTRVSLPIELAGDLGGARFDSRHVSPTWHRERWLSSPAEYCAAHGISRGVPGLVAAVVLLDHDGNGLTLGQLAADVGHLAFMTDRLGLVGPAVAEQHGAESQAVASLLEQLPVFRFTTGHVTTGTARQIWPRLSSVLETERAS